MRTTIIIATLFMCLGLSGCFEKEEPIEAFPRGDVEEFSLEMGPKYYNQVFYSLEQNAVVKTVLRTDWDISYSSTKDNFTLYLNTGNSMYAARTEATSLEDVTDTVGLDFKWDWSNGRDDSTALVDWQEGGKVYVINVGNDLDILPLGFVKAQFSLEGQDLVMTYAKLEENTTTTVRLKKNETYNRVYYSFNTHQELIIEPPKDQYDLVFRQYIYYFEAEDLAYNVVGALVNPNNPKVSPVFDKDFADITISDTMEYVFQSNHDVVGYDWKEFDLAEGFYVVYPDKNFIFKNSQGFIYKFHFVDFYNMAGDRGYPKIEQKLL